MGRARLLLLALATLAIAAPASGDVADTWAPYTPAVEQVQSIAATPGGTQQALLAVVARPLSGLSRVDVIRPVDDPANPRVRELTPIPTDPLHIGTGVEVDPFGNQYVGVASMRGDGRSIAAGVLRRRPYDDPGDWVHLAGRFDFAAQMEYPWGLAYHPNGSLYVTDAARGEIVRIKNAASAGNPGEGTWFVDANPAYRPVGDVQPGSGVFGTRPLGVTGIAVCRASGGFFCFQQGNLLVINTSTGWLYEVEVLPDTTLGNIELRGIFDPRSRVTSLQIDSASNFFYVESAIHRVRRMSHDGDFGPPPLLWGCPGSDPSDVAVIGGTAFIANRSGLTSPNPMCPMPSVTRVIMSP